MKKKAYNTNTTVIRKRNKIIQIMGIHNLLQNVHINHYTCDSYTKIAQNNIYKASRYFHYLW